ncbi:MAG: DUF4345 family protein [Candidatus Binatia bacterium]|nr:DUF4345 family protein [Candidatus Binatia bacterium]
MNKLKVRQALLTVLGLVLLSFAGFNFLDPTGGAEAAGLQFASLAGLNEYRAVFSGMFGGLAVGAFLAARNPENVLLGDAIALAVLGEAIARTSSIAIDGYPGPTTLLLLATEIAPLSVLLVRPTPALRERVPVGAAAA